MSLFIFVEKRIQRKNCLTGAGKRCPVIVATATFNAGGTELMSLGSKEEMTNNVPIMEQCWKADSVCLTMS